MERVNGMPIRCVITKYVADARYLKGIFKPGEVFDWDLSDAQLFNEQHPGCIQEIVMTEQDWIDLATSNALKSEIRINELEELYGEKFFSNNISVIPQERGEKVDGHGYGGGLRDAYDKTILLQEDVKNFEEQCIENLLNQNTNGKNI